MNFNYLIEDDYLIEDKFLDQQIEDAEEEYFFLQSELEEDVSEKEQVSFYD